MIAPLLLEELIKKFPAKHKDDLTLLFRETYKYGFNDGKLAQREYCDCSNPFKDDDDGTVL